VDSICGSTILRDPEFGDLLLAGISGRVWSDMRGTAVRVDMLSASFFHMHSINTFDDLIRVDLQASSAVLYHPNSLGYTYVACKRHDG
jgi:hypothetical protein